MIADLLDLVDRWAGLLETAVLVWGAFAAGSAVFVAGLAGWGVCRVWRALPICDRETAGEHREVAA